MFKQYVIMNLLTLFNCDCPPPTELDTIPDLTCGIDLNQVQRVFLIRTGGASWDRVTPTNNFPATISGDAPEDVTGWNTLLTETGVSKLIKTPLGPEGNISDGGAITNGGGDNTTLNGEVQYNGTNPALFSIRYDSLTKEIIAAMRKLQCEKQLSVYLANNVGKLIGKQDIGSDVFTAIPVTNFYVGTKVNNGFTTRDANFVTFQLAANYDESLEFIEPNGWNPLTI